MNDPRKCAIKRRRRKRLAYIYACAHYFPLAPRFPLSRAPRSPLRQMADEDAAIAVQQDVGQAVDVRVKRPRAWGWIYPAIVMEGQRLEQYDQLWLLT